MSTPIPAADWLEAANSGKLPTLKAWKRDGRLEADAFKRLVSICNADRNNALQMAIRHGHEDYALALAKLGRWPDSMDAERQSSLTLAVKHNMGDMVQALIDMGHATGMRPRQELSLMDIACREGCGISGRALLANGVKDVSYPILCDLVYILARRSTVLDCGMRICPGEELELLDGLLAAGVDPNWSGEVVPTRSCLQQWSSVVERGELANEFQIEVLHVLLKHGADTEQRVCMGSKGPGLPGSTWIGWETGLQEFLREHKARMCQNAMDQAVAEPCAIGATTRRM